MDRELDAACARALGIETRLVEDDVSVFTVDRQFLDTGDYYYIDVEGSTRRLPLFSTDPTAARMLEKHIGARGLEARYIDALIEIVNQDGDGSNPVGWIDWDERGSITLWPLIFATPLQRARAFVEATKNARTGSLSTPSS